MTFRTELRECIVQLHEAMLTEVAKDELNADYLLRLMATALCQLLAGQVSAMDTLESPTDNPDQLQLFEPPCPGDD